MKRRKENSWEEEDDREDRALLKLKKKNGNKCFHIAPRYWRHRKRRSRRLMNNMIGKEGVQS